MVNVYVFDTSLQLVTIYDDYKSLIWAKKYNDIGECELYIEATTDTLANLQKGYYLKKSDDDMLCRIKRIEIDTDAENGNYLIINGYDVKDILDQRIVWGVEKVKNVYSETYLRRLITENVISPTDSGRAISLVALAPANDLKAKTTEEIKYVNLGEKVREICKLNHWGYKAFLDDGKINFKFYIGSDKSTSVIFSPKFDNLSTTKTIIDASEIENVSLVVGGSKIDVTSNITEVVGTETGLSRYENYVESNDVTNDISYSDLKKLYPSGAPDAKSPQVFNYKVPTLNVQIITQNQLAWLQAHYPTGQIVDGSYYLTDVDIAFGLSGLDPSDDETVHLMDIVYLPNLATKGLEAQTNKKEKTTFEGTVFANVTYKYKTDYNLGDVVKIINELGIQCNARIIEMTETVDDNGYNLNPTFEYEVT